MLYFLKHYPYEVTVASVFTCSDRTFRDYCRRMVHNNAQIHNVCFFNFLIENNNIYSNIWIQISFDTMLNSRSYSFSLLSVDGVDFKIREPQPFSESWYSLKFNRPFVRYEISICKIFVGSVLWSYQSINRDLYFHFCHVPCTSA